MVAIRNLVPSQQEGADSEDSDHVNQSVWIEAGMGFELSMLDSVVVTKLPPPYQKMISVRLLCIAFPQLPKVGSMRRRQSAAAAAAAVGANTHYRFNSLS